MLPVLTLLVACTGPGQDSAAEDAPYLLDEDTPPSPSLSPDTIGALLGDAVGLLRTLNAAPLLHGYDTAMRGAESGCPSSWMYQGQPYWADDCFSADGTHFSGYAFHTLYFNQNQPDGSVVDGETFSGAAEITTGDGAIFSGGGDAWDLTTTSADGGTTWSSGTTGAFGWDGDGAADTWLETAVVPELTMTVVSDAEGAVTVTVDGGLTGMEGADAVVFDGLSLFGASSCPTEPAAVLSVRDTNGEWYDVIFDGPSTADAAVEADVCDGCGAAWFGGEPLGAVCVDFSPMLDWEEAPWE